MGNNNSTPKPVHPYNVQAGNWTQYVVPAVNAKTNANFVVGGKGQGPDPAFGCGKQFSVNYRCGIGAFKSINLSPEATGKTAVFDCSKEVKLCDAASINVQDDGNLVIYKTGGKPLWSSNTTGKKGPGREGAKAKYGKYKRNYLLPGEYLEVGEWVGSPSGTCYLLMQEGGLVLIYDTYQCEGSDQDHYSVNDTSMALYRSPRAGGNLAKNIGKVGYVSDDNVLREYPPSMVSKGDTYDNVGKYDSTGNALSEVSDTTPDMCKIACNKDDKCNGFVYRSSDKHCWLKTDGMYPKGLRQARSDLDLYTRNPSVINNQSCTTHMNDITSSDWDSYLNKGEMMSIDTLCDLGAITEEQRGEVLKSQGNLENIASEINKRVKNLTESDKNVLRELGVNTESLDKKLKEYEETYKKLKREKKSLVRAEGMDDDANLQLITKNYHYILWSILAVIIIIGSLRVTRKK